MSNKEYTAEGIVEYFEGLVEYMRKLGYEDPRDKRIEELESDKSTLQQSLSNACGRIKELEGAKELQYEIMELKNQEIEELEMLLNEYKDAECRAVKLHGAALTRLGALEAAICKHQESFNLREDEPTSIEYELWKALEVYYDR